MFGFVIPVKTGIQVVLKKYGFLSPLSRGQACPYGSMGRNDKKGGEEQFYLVKEP
jgi:hypothetical protein